MPKINCMITVDYENPIRNFSLADAEKYMITPAYEIMSFFESYGVPVTFFVDIAECLAYIDNNYASAPDMLKQFRYMMDHGHDIQVHFHPQWVDAVFDDGVWNQTTEVDNTNNTINLTDFIKTFTDGLSLLRSFNPNVCAYRGGSYLIEPLATNIPFLRSLDIKYDSSLGWNRARGPDLAEPFMQRLPGYDMIEIPICRLNRRRWDMSSAPEYVYTVFDIIDRFNSYDDDMHIIMMGHTKQKVNYAEMTEVFNTLKVRDDVCFSTFSSF